MKPLRYVLLGAAGYIAPRHLDAIRNTGGTLVAAADPHDSVGVLDTHFPAAAFFTGPDCDEQLFKAVALGDLGKVDRAVVCSPNDLHVVQTISAVNLGCDVICEKPLALTSSGLDEIVKAQARMDKSVWTVVQLRHLPRIMDLKPRWARTTGKHRVSLTYITSRGPWYASSWKGDQARSGGPLLNLGIHFLDLLTWCFGPAVSTRVDYLTGLRGRGTLTLERAEVDWFLSSDPQDLPLTAWELGDTAYRRMTVDDHEVDLNPNFVAGTHTTVYGSINTGNGFGAGDVRLGIEAAQMILNAAKEGATVQSQRSRTASGAGAR